MWLIAPPTYEVVEEDSALSTEAKSVLFLVVLASISASKDVTAFSMASFGLVLAEPIVTFLALDRDLLFLLVLVLLVLVLVLPFMLGSPLCTVGSWSAPFPPPPLLPPSSSSSTE